jgi:hypothetical protein
VEIERPQYKLLRLMEKISTAFWVIQIYYTKEIFNKERMLYPKSSRSDYD